GGHGAVVAAVARIAPADERLDLAALRIGDHYRAFEPRLAEAALLVVLRDALGERALGRSLRARIERGEDAQALGAQVLLVVVAPQLPVHELHERGVGRGAHHRTRRDAELGRARGRVLLERDEALVLGLAQHEVAPLERALRVSARIVPAGALDPRS